MVVNLREIQVSLLTRREDFISGMLCICSFGFGPTSIFTSLSLFDANTNISRPITHTELSNIRKFYMSHGYIKCRFILHSLGRDWSYPIYLFPYFRCWSLPSGLYTVCFVDFSTSCYSGVILAYVVICFLLFYYMTNYRLFRRFIPAKSFGILLSIWGYPVDMLHEFIATKLIGII